VTSKADVKGVKMVARMVETTVYVTVALTVSNGEVDESVGS
jgi:hypothetical protein